MGKLSQTDQHSPVVQTGQPNLEEKIPPLKVPGKHNQQPVKKEVHPEHEKDKKTGSR